MGGSPLVCAAALKTMEIIERDKLDQNARDLGTFLNTQLTSLRDKFPTVIKNIRGLGLMIGIELVKDRTTKEAHPDAMHQVEIECFKRGLITLGCGASTIRLSPPLVISQDQGDFAIKTLDEVFGTIR